MRKSSSTGPILSSLNREDPRTEFRKREAATLGHMLEGRRSPLRGSNVFRDTRRSARRAEGLRATTAGYRSALWASLCAHLASFRFAMKGRSEVRRSFANPPRAECSAGIAAEAEFIFERDCLFVLRRYSFSLGVSVPARPPTATARYRSLRSLCARLASLHF